MFIRMSVRLAAIAFLALTFSLPAVRAAAGEGVTGPLGARSYWEDGIRFDSPKSRFRLRFNGRAYFDWGSTFADRELEEAFPGLEGRHGDFRTLEGSIYGWFGELLEFKISIDFANVKQVKDNWARFPNIPVLRQFRIGNIKEPFSLEEQTSSIFLTFMEVAMPTYAFTPGRDIGLRTDQLAMGGRLTWAAGVFLNTGSLSTVGDTKDEISGATGWNLTGRVAGVLWYEEMGRRLAHIGASYSRQFRNKDQGTAKAYPETRLTDDKLVDSGDFSTDGNDLLGIEGAIVYGPFSLQGEIIAKAVNSSGTSLMWGGYGFLSWILTGEHRRYDRPSAVFKGVRPKSPPPWKKGYGAWELALRLSYIDLNDGDIGGGKERNVTAGLNWYLSRQYRLMFNYINARVTDRSTPPAVDDGSEQTYAARFAFWF